MTTKFIYLGDEAIAQAAIAAGASAVYSYPGTPATEIMECVQKTVKTNPGLDIRCAWSINEKVALEEAIGVSMIGKRVLVAMKHVGLNVAADPFMNAAITGTNGGLVICVADDPSMHSSQNEQDSRFYSWFAKIFCFEPVDSQEAFDMVLEAFDLSEKLKVPVMVRITTRVAHSRSVVIVPEKARPQNPLALPEQYANWTLLPSNARPQYAKLLQKQSDLTAVSNAHTKNELQLKPRTTKGVITGGTAWLYFMECLPEITASSLRIATYPLPTQKILALLDTIDELFVIEEGYPLIETLVFELIHKTGKAMTVHGRGDGTIPHAGELNPEVLRKALGLAVTNAAAIAPPDLVKTRPPQLCQGCPHADTFKALNKALEGCEQERLVFSDIGCYTLGAYPPYQAIHSCVCMGASISMAKAAGENGLKYAVAVLGDSTFEHSGITPLLEGISRGVAFTTIIVDNSLIAMTGGQQRVMGEEQFLHLILGTGISKDHVRVIRPIPKNHEENTRIIKEELEYRGPSVVVARRECLQG